MTIGRRNLILSGAALGLLGAARAHAHPKVVPDYDLPEALLPRVVPIDPRIAPYEVHVLPDVFALFWTLPGAQAIRYVAGIGRPGLYEPGEFSVGAKKEWPSWTPTPGMLERQPELYERWADGMPGGLDNPLGARALYLFTPERGDTFLRIHGTDDPRTIGRAVSNGCARLVNDQIVDLYERVPLGTRILLYAKTVASPAEAAPVGQAAQPPSATVRRPAASSASSTAAEDRSSGRTIPSGVPGP